MNWPRLCCTWTFYKLGQLALARQDLAAAQAHLEQARQAALAWLAACRLEQGHIAAALRLSAQALAEIQALAGGEEMQYVYWQRWRILRAADESAAADEILEQAHALVQRMVTSLSTPEEQRACWENVPANREIAAAYTAFQPRTQPRQTTAQLPRADAPQGGRLNSRYLTPVVWTLAAPEDANYGDDKERRRHCLLRLLREAEAQGARPALSDLAAALGVNVRTIKRDLGELRQAGHVIHTRGKR